MIRFHTRELSTSIAALQNASELKSLTSTLRDEAAAGPHSADLHKNTPFSSIRKQNTGQ